MSEEKCPRTSRIDIISQTECTEIYNWISLFPTTSLKTLDHSTWYCFNVSVTNIVIYVCLTGFHLHTKLPTLVPESCLLIVLGLIVGSILHFSKVATTSEYVLNAEIFFIYLLPPIIFDAGYFMPIRSFFDNIGSVLLLAVVNTAFNTACIGFSLYAVASWGWIGPSISLLHCFIFR